MEDYYRGTKEGWNKEILTYRIPSYISLFFASPLSFKTFLYILKTTKTPILSIVPPDHGRIEIRKIWTTTEFNDYLSFPHIGQAFLIKWQSTNKKTGETSCEIAYGITSRTPEQADPQSLPATDRGHWCIENSCHYIIDWNYDKDHSRIRIGYGR